MKLKYIVLIIAITLGNILFATDINCNDITPLPPSSTSDFEVVAIVCDGGRIKIAKKINGILGKYYNDGYVFVDSIEP